MHNLIRRLLATMVCFTTGHIPAFAFGPVLAPPPVDGVPLDASMDGLNGRATPDGLWLSPPAGEASGAVHQVSVKAVAWGRSAMEPLAEMGEVRRKENITSFQRADLTEEYSVSEAGIRQDFVVVRSPEGAGDLRVDLRVRGAVARESLDGIRLRLPGSEIELDYGALLVTDAAQRVLPAWLEVLEPGRLQIRVQDGGARYPVRIDPTFSNAGWTGRGGEPGLYYYANGVVPDPEGGFHVFGVMTIAGTKRVDGITRWDGFDWQNIPSPEPEISGLRTGVRFAGSLVVSSGAWVYRWTGSVWELIGTANADIPNGPSYGHVQDLIVHDGKLVACGQFSGISGVPARNVAVWDGVTWAALGSGVSGGVGRAQVACSLGTNLVVGGLFSLAGGVSVANIARWDGHQWNAVGAGTNGEVLALEEWNGDLFAGGAFTQAGAAMAYYVARWSGSDWFPLSGGVNQAVHCLKVFGSNLVVGGTFDSADGLPARGVASWDGSAWAVLGSGLESEYFVRAQDMAVLNGELVVAGVFVLAGGKVASNIARWDGTNWHAFGEGLGGKLPSSIHAAAWFNGELYAGGNFILTHAGSTTMHIAKWTAGGWVGVGGGLNGRVRALVEHDGALVAGGDFTQAGGGPASRVARWDGSAWSSLGGGASHTVNSLVSHQGKLVAGGTFLQAGSTNASRIAAWDGSSWLPLGAGMNGEVSALASRGTELFAGGYFTTAGPVPASRIARWDGSSWTSLGAGMNAHVLAIIPFAGGLVAGGGFTQAGGVSRNRIAFWDGTTWQSLGSGVNNTVFSLTSSGGWLFAGGGFSTASGVPANRIAAWNGSTWTGLGSGLSGFLGDDSALALVSQDNRLDVFGKFKSAGDVAANMAAQFDFTPAPPQVSALSVTNLTHNSAILTGWINPQGSPATARLEYGTGTNFASSFALPLSPANGTSPQPVSVRLTGLAPDTPHLARLVAQNSDGSVTGPEVSFTTQPPPDANDLLAAWRTLYFQSPANAGAGADAEDPDGDGEVNLLEWACGSDPTIATAPVLAPDAPSSGLRCRYERISDAVAAGVIFTVEQADSLPATGWTAIPQTVIADDGIRQEVIADIPPGAVTRYVRLKVTLPP